MRPCLPVTVIGSASLLALLLLPMAVPAGAETIHVTVTVQKSGLRNDMPAPQQSQIKFRSTKTGKVVAEGTVPGSPDSGQFKTAAVKVPPGKYELEVHMRDSLSHYEDTQTVTVRPGKTSQGITATMRKLNDNEVREYKARNEVDKADKKIAKADADVREYGKLRDLSKRAGNDELAGKFQKKLDAAAREKAKQEQIRATRKKKLDKLHLENESARAARKNVGRAGKTRKPHIDHEVNGPY